MSWRLAESLGTLRKQINTLSPNRSKASDGTVGDAAHASRSSDHNPHVRDGASGVVTALDITHDPAHGIDAGKIARALVASKDQRIKYVISNGEIASSSATGGKPAWAWRKYTGSNPHSKHFHVSVKASKALYDDTMPWVFGGVDAGKAATPPVPNSTPLLKRGSKGDDVARLQIMLGISVDKSFGRQTEEAVKAFQKANGLVPDGRVGVYTWEALEKKAKPAPAKPVAAVQPAPTPGSRKAPVAAPAAPAAPRTGLIAIISIIASGIAAYFGWR